LRAIEIAGAVGAGKSSLVQPLQRALHEAGLPVRPVNEVVRLRRLTLKLWTIAFALGHSRLTVSAARAALAAPIPWWHRRLIFGLTLGVGGRLLAASRAAAHDQWVLVDEGLVHRTVNLYGWRSEVPRREVTGYLEHVPMSGPLVVVDVSPGEGFDRATARGLPKRLTRRSDADVLAFVARSTQIIALAADVMERRGVSVVRVDNGGELAETVRSAARRLTPALSPRPTEARVPTLALRFPMLPRPDRVVRRLRGRRARGLDESLVRAVLNAYDLSVNDRPRAIPSPGGRGRSMRVQTADGDVMVKQYKPSATAAGIALEHAVLRELERHCQSVPRLRGTRDGVTSIELESGLHYAVFNYDEGYIHPHEYIFMPSDRRRVDELAGLTLAALHRTLDGYEPPPSDTLGFTGRAGLRVRPVDWFVSQLRESAAPAELRAWLEETLVTLARRLDDADLERGVVHGDYGPYNLMLRRGFAALVVDWELTRLDWRLVDIATALPRFAQRRTGFDMGAAHRVLRAYIDGSGMPVGDVVHIPGMLAFLNVQKAILSLTGPRTTASGRDDPGRYVGLARALLDGRHPMSRVGDA
jgi:Ser/Thr protein kinase RdoA (MazF antagonist)